MDLHPLLRHLHQLGLVWVFLHSSGTCGCMQLSILNISGGLQPSEEKETFFNVTSGEKYIQKGTSF